MMFGFLRFGSMRFEFVWLVNACCVCRRGLLVHEYVRVGGQFIHHSLKDGLYYTLSSSLARSMLVAFYTSITFAIWFGLVGLCL